MLIPLSLLPFPSLLHHFFFFTHCAVDNQFQQCHPLPPTPRITLTRRCRMHSVKPLAYQLLKVKKYYLDRSSQTWRTLLPVHRRFKLQARSQLMANQSIAFSSSVISKVFLTNTDRQITSAAYFLQSKTRTTGIKASSSAFKDNVQYLSYHLIEHADILVVQIIHLQGFHPSSP